MCRGHGLWIGIGNLEIGQVPVDVGIQIEVPPFGYLHHRGPGEQLGDRAGPECGLGGVNRGLVCQVCEAISFGQKHLAVLHHDDRRARDVQFRHLGLKESVQKGLHLFRASGAGGYS